MHPTLRVLIVDDERSIADTLGMIVQGAGYIVRIAYSGEQAAAIADNFLPEVAITDVTMPGMDGFELARWLGEHHPQCRVLFFTGHMDIVVEAEMRGSAVHPPFAITKPVHPTVILSFLDSCTTA